MSQTEVAIIPDVELEVEIPDDAQELQEVPQVEVTIEAEVEIDESDAALNKQSDSDPEGEIEVDVMADAPELELPGVETDVEVDVVVNEQLECSSDLHSHILLEVGGQAPRQKPKNHCCSVTVAYITIILWLMWIVATVWWVYGWVRYNTFYFGDAQIINVVTFPLAVIFSIIACCLRCHANKHRSDGYEEKPIAMEVGGVIAELELQQNFGAQLPVERMSDPEFASDENLEVEIQVEEPVVEIEADVSANAEISMEVEAPVVEFNIAAEIEAPVEVEVEVEAPEVEVEIEIEAPEVEVEIEAPEVEVEAEVEVQVEL